MVNKSGPAVAGPLPNLHLDQSLAVGGGSVGGIAVDGPGGVFVGGNSGVGSSSSPSPERAVEVATVELRFLLAKG